MVLSQLTRAPERDERKPQLADLRESGAIEQDADVVLFINRPNFYKTDLPEEDRAKAELIIAKQRNGPTGSLNFVFLAATRASKRRHRIPGVRLVLRSKASTKASNNSHERVSL